jgi:uncharacterized membrane protein YqhA
MSSNDSEPSRVTGEVEREAAHATTIARILGSSRWLVWFAVIGLFLSSATILIYGTLLAVKTIWDTIDEFKLTSYGLEHLTVEFVLLTDAFLLGCVLIIVALGLFQLFVESNVPLPPWLRVTTLDELKAKLLGVTVVLVSVSFVGLVVEWDGDDSILEIGLSIAAVILAISVFLAISGHGGNQKHE